MITDSVKIKTALLGLLQAKGLACTEASLSVSPLPYQATPICYIVTAREEFAQVLATEVTRLTGRYVALSPPEWLLFQHDAQAIVARWEAWMKCGSSDLKCSGAN
jgi:hypothetical protein